MRSGRVSVSQNYSPHVVALGVNADTILSGQQLFINPEVSSKTVNGSSFATPIVTGKISANYFQLPASGSRKKVDVLNMLAAIHEIKNDPSAAETVFQGGFIKK